MNASGLYGSTPPDSRGPLGRSPTRLAVRNVILRPLAAAGPAVYGDVPHTVLVAGGAIEAILADTAEAPDDATVVDGKGAHLLPGLADMHVHVLDESDLLLYVANGVTTVRHMWGTPWHLTMRRRIEDGQLLGPRLRTTSPVIDGVGQEGRPYWPGSVALTDAEAADALVAGCCDAGYEQIKAYSWLRPDVLSALGRAAAARGIRTVGHCPDGMTFEEAVGAGMSCFEHLTGIERGHVSNGAQRRPPHGHRRLDPEAIWQVVRGVDMDAIRRLGGWLAQREVWNCPTLIVHGGIIDPGVDEAGVAGEQLMSPGVLDYWNQSRARLFAAPPETVSALRAHQERRFEMVAALHAEGARLLAGTDANNPSVVPGLSLQQELVNLVAAGLSPFEALRSATSGPAEFLGEAGQWGVIQPGARADLLLVRGDPLEDIRALSRIEGVVCRGRHLDRAALDGLLRDRAAAVAAHESTATA